jgi:hypothetical protein
MNQPLASLTNLSRLAPESHFMSLAKAADYEHLSAYSPANILAWVKHVGKYWFGAKHPFQVYLPGETGIFPLGNQAQVCLAGDWGTGTGEAAKVAKQILAAAPDYTVHLGDVYYTGSAGEIAENFLGVRSPATDPFDPVEWPHGSKGTFAQLGNHEMFTHGDFYFSLLLPALNQKTSYFCLENDFWRIVAVDTAYNSTGLDLWPFRPSCKIPDPVMTWLGGLHLAGDSRGLIILSHHQPWSSFETWYPAAAKQLAQFTNPLRPVLWFWGHEHRMAVYDRYAMGGLVAHGACIGHGGMPVELKTPDNSRVTCLFTDAREYDNDEGLKVGYNGYASLSFDNEHLRVEFRDLNGWVVYGENWLPTIS